MRAPAHLLGSLRALVSVTLKRIAAQPGLAIASVLGLTLAVALVMSIPLYADAVYLRLFLAGVTATPGAEATSSGGRSPFGYLFRYSGATHGAKQWAQIEPVTTYLLEQAQGDIGLPQQFAIRYVHTDPFGLFTSGETSFKATDTPIMWAGFGTLTDLAAHVVLTEGRMPIGAAAGADMPLETMVSETLATRIGLQVGETYTAFFRNERNGRQNNTALALEIVGVWRPRDPNDSFWFYDPSAFDEKFLVDETTFAGPISEALDDEVNVAVWYLAMDGTNIQHQAADELIRGGMAAEQKAAALLPNTRLVHSPVAPLRAYRSAKRLLTVLLYAFSIPIVGLLLTFISLVSKLWVERRRNEIAVMRSRGAPIGQVTQIAVLEGIVLGVLALIAGGIVGQQLARLMGQTRGFLDFVRSDNELGVQFTVAALQLGIAAIAMALAAQVLPTRQAARDTVVTYKQERARRMRKPWWQRAGIDLLLMVPTVYGMYLLREQGSLVQFSPVMRGQIFQNPLLFLVPTLGLVSLTLLFLRVLPILMTGVAWFASHTHSVGLMLAARHLARTPRYYSTPLTLLVLTLSLSAFTATLAQTLNTHLHDQAYYAIGADMRFVDTGESIAEEVQAYLNPAASDGAAAGTGPRWLFVPVTEYHRLPGVIAVTRIGRYSASANLGGGQQPGTFLGVDRADFAKVAFWRSDFADESLGALMNALALQPDGVLLPSAIMRENVLTVGDKIRLTVDTHGQINAIDVVIVGSFDLFPTWYPENGPLFVGNLDYLFQEAGGQFPYRVWMRTQPDADLRVLGTQGRVDLGLRLLDWKAPALDIASAQQRPERQGLFGVLSIGFAAAGIVTVLGFMLYALFSFQRRLIEFGVLRAIGLSSSHMTSVLAWELALLVALGTGVGTALGAGMSRLFIPYLQVGSTEVERVPPYIIEVAWPSIFRVYTLFGVLFIVALTVLVLALRSMRIYQAIKLGESA